MWSIGCVSHDWFRLYVQNVCLQHLKKETVRLAACVLPLVVKLFGFLYDISANFSTFNSEWNVTFFLLVFIPLIKRAFKINWLSFRWALFHSLDCVVCSQNFIQLILVLFHIFFCQIKLVTFQLNSLSRTNIILDG